MSSHTQQKPDFTALYRLEFYKKQKNWKFCVEGKVKKQPKKSTNLNVTYSIEQSEAKEQTDPLNDAFVDSDLDTNIKYTNTRSELLQQLQEPGDIEEDLWEDHPEYTNNLSEANPRTEECLDILTIVNDDVEARKSFVQKRLDDLQNAAKSLEFDTNTESNLEDIWNDNDFWKDCFWLDDACAEMAQDWNINNQVFTEHENNGFNNGNNIQSTESLYQPDYLGHDYGIPEEQCSVWSVDSAAEFMRGAHAVPHSSELDLALPACVNTLDVSFTSLSRLSSSQLALATELHSRVLNRLLLESEHRQRLRNAPLCHSSSSLEGYPTKDLLCPIEDTRNMLFFKDVFIAGSHRNY